MGKSARIKNLTVRFSSPLSEEKFDDLLLFIYSDLEIWGHQRRLGSTEAEIYGATKSWVPVSAKVTKRQIVFFAESYFGIDEKDAAIFEKKLREHLPLGVRVKIRRKTS